MAADLREQLQHDLADTYTFERELAGGAMSHVFVASDNALGRRVVVKVLRATLAEGLSAERFKREIQLAARLQHPHIVPLLTAGALKNGSLYYTMPFVDGESLRLRLEREGALPLADVTRLARDTASALAYAHRQHVVHRDIKPENILVADGGAVVTDFGIAKAIQAAREDAGDNDGRHSSTLTQRGTSLGTPAYMAPEQAAGDSVDQRADLYALGVVAYEMLAGRPPFDGRTAQRLLAAHATEAPEPVDRRRPSVPPALAALVMRLLEKQPADRPQTADEVLRSLDAIVATLSELQPTWASPGARPRHAGARTTRTNRLHDPLVLALALATVVSTAALAWLVSTRRGALAATAFHARLPLELPTDARVDVGGPGTSIALSPDGSTLVYAGRSSPPRLFVRRLDSLVVRPLAGTEYATNPQFSPDGRWIAFRTSASEIKKVALGGGPVTTIVRDASTRFAWGARGTIVFSKLYSGFFTGLWQVDAEGGRAEKLTQPDSMLGGNYGSPAFLPDGETVLFTSSSRRGDLALAAVRLHDRKVVPLGVVGGSATYLESGYLLYASIDGSVSAVRFDPKALRVSGQPITVLDSVAVKAGNVAELSVARNGTLVYLRGNLGRQLVEMDRGGNARSLIPTQQNYAAARVSPDGRRVALSIGQPPYSSDIWVYDIASTTLTRLTTGGTNAVPEWTPDGRRIAWTSDARGHDGIWWQPWDQSAPAELLVPRGRGVRFIGRGDSVITSFEVAAGLEVRVVPLPFDSLRPARVVLPRGAVDRQLSLSPDGRWLAYVSDEAGAREVYVQRFPGPGPRVQASTGSGAGPRWSPNGKELFYFIPGCCVVSATIATSPELAVVRRDSLFSVRGVRGTYDVTPDGKHFVLARDAGTTSAPIIVFGWGDEVREQLTRARAP